MALGYLEATPEQGSGSRMRGFGAKLDRFGMPRRCFGG